MYSRIFVIVHILFSFQVKSSSTRNYDVEKHIFSLIYNQQFSEAEEGRTHFSILTKRFPQNTLFRDIANVTNTKF